MKKHFLSALFCAAIVGMTFTACKDKESYFDAAIGDATELYPAELALDDDGDFLYGYIDKSGNEVVKGKYTSASTYYNGRALVATEDADGNLLYKFLDESGAEMGGTYLEAEPYNCDLALVVDKDTVTKFIDKSGAEVLNFGKVGIERYDGDGNHLKYLSAYSEVKTFMDDMACFRDTFGYYGFMNKKGEVVIPAQFSASSNFSEGYACVYSGAGNFYFIDKKGKVATKLDKVLDMDFITYYFGYFCDGLCLIHDNNGYTFINTKGNIFPYYYSLALPFVGEGMAPAMQGDKFGLINKKGEFAVAPTYEQEISFYHEDRAVFKNNDNADGVAQEGVIDGKGNVIIPAGNYAFFDGFLSFPVYHNGLLHAKTWNADGTKCTCTYLDKDGGSVWTKLFEFGGSPAPARRALTREEKERKDVFRNMPGQGFMLGR